jgi:hypothetical protein
MTEEEWVLVDKVEGQLQAEMLRGLLEAQGIMVWVNPQGAARAYAVTIGTLGAVELLVPSSAADQARQVLDAYYRGDFEDMELKGSEANEEPGE